MLPLVFVGGAITGAAGLLAAALWDKHNTESEYSPALKTPQELDAQEVRNQLYVYFMKAQEIHRSCSMAVAEATKLQGTSIALPDDGLFQKAVNTLDDGMNRVCRGLRESHLRDLKDESRRLYHRYRGVFQRANAILQERWETPVSLKGITFEGQKFAIDNSLENEDWCWDFDELADQIRAFIDTSCEIADQLDERLKQEKPLAAICCESY